MLSFAYRGSDGNVLQSGELDEEDRAFVEKAEAANPEIRNQGAGDVPGSFVPAFDNQKPL